MAPRAPDGRPHPPTTAVVQVAEDGTAKLYLGTDLVEHAAGADAADVMRVLVDYAATINTGVRVTTQMPDGTWLRHRLEPDGTIIEIPPHASPLQPPEPRTVHPMRQADVSAKRTGPWARVVSRTPVIAVMLLLAAVLVAILIADANR